MEVKSVFRVSLSRRVDIYPASQDPAAIRLYLQQERAYGSDDVQGIVEAKTQHFRERAAGPSTPQSPRYGCVWVSEPDPVFSKSSPT